MKPPHDQAVERALLGALQLDPRLRDLVVEQLTIEDFYIPIHQRVFGAIVKLAEAGSQLDPLMIADTVRQTGGACDPVELVEMQADAPASAYVSGYIEILQRQTAARRAQRIGMDVMAGIEQGDDPWLLADEAKARLEAIDCPMLAGNDELPTFDEVVSAVDEVSPWVIPGLLRSDERAVFVGIEGSGKSVLSRQIALLASQGLHPFTFQDMTPIRTFLVDLENPLDAIQETGAHLTQATRVRKAKYYRPERMRMLRRPEGLDPTQPQGRALLERYIAKYRPDLVCIGPAYKMLNRRAQRQGSESHEEATDRLFAVLDTLRIRYQFALVIEHHAPQGYGPHREMRPYGSQRWLAWPDFGFGLQLKRGSTTNYRLNRWRGDRVKRSWPDELHYGNPFPWTGYWDKPPDLPPDPPDDQPF